MNPMNDCRQTRLRQLAGAASAALGMVAVLCAVAWGGEDPFDAEYFRMLFEKKFPGFVVTKAGPSPIDGIVEVQGAGPQGPKVVYVTADGRYLLAGVIVDLERQVNLTRGTLSGLAREQLASVNIDELAVMITPPAGVPGKGGRPILYFVDPECPYCRKWHPELHRLVNEGWTVAVMLYPNGKTHAGAVKKSHAVWCAEDRVGAFDAVMNGNEPDVPDVPDAIGAPNAPNATGGTNAPNAIGGTNATNAIGATTTISATNATGGCRAPLSAIRKVGTLLQVSGTPFLILPNGQKVTGYRSAGDLLPILNAEEKP